MREMTEPTSTAPAADSGGSYGPHPAKLIPELRELCRIGGTISSVEYTARSSTVRAPAGGLVTISTALARPAGRTAVQAGPWAGGAAAMPRWDHQGGSNDGGTEPAMVAAAAPPHLILIG